jgi:hypothetical protein
MINALSYFAVHLTPTLLAVGLAWMVFRSVGVRVVWRQDE